MSGKLCNHNNGASRIKESKAYCEGRAAAVAGILIGANPHPAGADADAWAAGHGSHLGGAAGPRDCCANPPTVAP